ncbi:MAG: tetratricopeptide repeat protein, partial [Candidatus Thiodiazotropha endolucinida]
MPIQQVTTITTHDKALELFTDRLAERRLFFRYLHTDPPPERLIFFHGNGGNGKSLLLKHLRTVWCRLLATDEWAQIDTHPDDRAGNQAFVDGYQSLVTEKHPPIPCIYHDFDREKSGEESPREAWSVLLGLRKELARHKLKLPFFDYAVMRYLHIGRGLSRDQIRSMLPMEELDLATTLLDLITSPEIPVAGLINKLLEIFDKHSKTKLALWFAKRGLDEARLDELHRMEPNSDLPDALPQIFGEDLNTAMQLSGAPARLVLMFDSHEAFWGTERHLQSTDAYFQRDAWLRRFLAQLFNPNHRVLLVLAGREPPRWHEAPYDPIPRDYIDTQLVGHLDNDDADDYLRRALGQAKEASDEGDESSNGDELLREALIHYAEAEPGQVHPLHLGLAADVVLMARRQGEQLTAASFADTPALTQKGRILVTRFLKHCPRDIEDAVEALAAARGFDKALFYSLGERLHFHATDAAFATLTGFSFVWEDSRPGEDDSKPWYRIHNLLRRVLEEYAQARVQQAHAALETIYREDAQTNPIAIAEAIYHVNQQEWERGYREWIETMEEALQNATYDLAETLADLRFVLRLETVFARGYVDYQVAYFNRQLSRYQDSSSAYAQAVASYDEVLARAPDYVLAHNNKSNTLLGLGELRAALSEHEGAANAYTQAVAACDEALARAPDYVAALINKGNALQGLGKLRAALSDHENSANAYTQAVAAYDEALARAPDDVAAYNNKGSALAGLGKLHAVLSDHENSANAYAQAVAACDEALARSPDYVAAHNNKGLALEGLGELRAALSDHEGAANACAQAIAAYDEALARAPDYVLAHNNKGNALQGLGELRAALSDHEGAANAYAQAVGAYDEALARAPDDVAAHNNKGFALAELGALRAALSDHEGAANAY